MSSFLRGAERELRERTNTLDPACFTIRSVASMVMAFRPTDHDSVFEDEAILLCADHAGFAFRNPEPTAVAGLDGLVGMDVRYLTDVEPVVRVAALDAGYRAISQPDETVTITGSPRIKAIQRAAIIRDEVLRLRPAPGRSRVHMVGAVGSIIHELRVAGCEVTASDLDPSVVGSEIAGVVVESSASAEDSLARADVVTITGMTLVNGSYDAVLDSAATCKKLVLAQTGSGLGRALIASGVDSVLAEPFPAYMFPSPTVIERYRKRN